MNSKRRVELVFAAWVVALTLFGLNLILAHDGASRGRLAENAVQRAYYRDSMQRLFGEDGQGATGPPRCLREPEETPPPRTRAPPILAAGPEAKIALFVLFYNRRDYLQTTMDSLLAAVPPENFPIFLSQDGDAEGMADFVREKWVDTGLATHLQFKARLDHSDEKFKSYYYIADHYKFALTHAFDVLKYDTVVLLEDDMLVAPDFFAMMEATAPMLHADETLLCVSAWNDNGMEGVVSPADGAAELRRTSVFPGLGWMLTRRLWEELRPRWPAAFWDDWLREPAQTRGRECLYPAVCRTKTIGAIGSSAGQFYNRYLARIVLNTQLVPWHSVNLAPLDRTVYRRQLLTDVVAARTVARGPELAKILKESDSSPLAIRVFWHGASDYKRLANQLRLMNDLKEGIPRSSFDGIVRLHVGNGGQISLFLVPATMRGSNGIPGTPPTTAEPENKED